MWSAADDGNHASFAMRPGADMRSLQLPGGFVVPEPKRIVVGIVVLHGRFSPLRGAAGTPESG